jgi:hypothetical protein
MKTGQKTLKSSNTTPSSEMHPSVEAVPYLALIEFSGEYSRIVTRLQDVYYTGNSANGTTLGERPLGDFTPHSAQRF